MTGIRLGDLAAAVGVELIGDPTVVIHGVGALDKAMPGEISFLTSPKYRQYLSSTQASAVILQPGESAHATTPVLLSDSPYLTYARIAARLHPPELLQPGSHPSAVIAASASVDDTVQIGPCTVVGERVRVEAGVYIGPGCVIGDDSEIGRDSRLLARVTVCHGTRIGRRAIIHPGAVLGSDGFGLANDNGRWEKVPQLGCLILGNDVEIGANTAIDRGALEDTILGDGVKLDNQVHVAHNVHIGDHTAIAACSGIAGSTRIGKHCTFGGMTGVAGHLIIGDNVHFSGMTPVTRSFPEAGYYSGNLPAVENGAWRKSVARIRHIDDMARRLVDLERRLAAMESGDE